MKLGKVTAVLAAAALSTGLLTAPTEVVAQPADAPDATSRYEAESAPAGCDGAIASNHSGYSGSGFCDTSNAVGSAVSFTVTAAAAGTATLAFRYANGSGANRPGDVSVNGAVVRAGTAFAATSSWTTWAIATVTVQLNAGTNTVRLAATTAGGLGNIDYLDVTTGDASNDTIMRGADVSTLQRAGDLGTKFYYPNGTQGDPLDILKSAGVNYIRLRIWNNPRSGYNNKAKVLEYARTVKAKGLKLMVDFHYSDTWADPGKQYKPAAWAGHGISQLQTDVYNYTYDVCTSLKAQGTTPDSVQIGNEIHNGMLWEEGRVRNGYANLGLLLKAGYNATKACNSSTQVVIHTANVESGARGFYDGIRAQGVQWDVTALSYYCYWHGSMSGMAGVVSDMKSRYGKPVILAETAYPFTTANYDHAGNIITSSQPCAGYPATPAGQQSNFAAVQNTSRNAGASGVFWWEPTWHAAVPGNGWDPEDINNSGNAWENQAVFDRTGRLNPNIRWLQ